MLSLLRELVEVVGNHLLAKRLFEVELLAAYYNVWVYENTSSGAPMVDIHLEIRVHNKRRSSTSVWAESLVVYAPGLEEGFPTVEIMETGHGWSGLQIATVTRTRIGGHSTGDFTLYGRKIFPRHFPEALRSGEGIRIKAELRETHGGSRELSADAQCRAITNQ